ncbi:DUF2937 family protein [Yoonia sediminilitoris]|uniref:DUF2937 family protein n=1 Tax=Yoonia sediminilitoris TaxID=1286148 RepID=A0A2T6KQ54_9RHOB|nr:DUF2937 family protein [Yoonia sediminilitoris]PUB18687.1 Protein of unknown function (DUF2937) [Yoonia sediminilitoris]RCW98855.1 DUF2937 family protein [Yoonia sediminilitoris]
MIRILCLMTALAGAAGLSQFPEFSQQYMQRLAGQVDELSRDLKQLDAMALDLRMGREERLEQMENTPTFAADAAFWREKIARHARLGAHLDSLRSATPMARLTMPQRFADTALLQSVWADFTPAFPLSQAGAMSGGVGFLTGWAGAWAALAAVLALIKAPFRRLRRQSGQRVKRVDPGERRDPVLERPSPIAQPHDRRPRLAGVQR